jgi:hypothetical protein
MRLLRPDTRCVWRAACDPYPLMGISVVSVLHRLCICLVRSESSVHTAHTGLGSPGMLQVDVVVPIPIFSQGGRLLGGLGGWVQDRASRAAANLWAIHVWPVHTLVDLA